MKYAKNSNLRNNLFNIVKDRWINKLYLLYYNLGLCKPVNYFQKSKENDIYGVLPFIAPEILRGQPYSLASDIYSFSMIMCELLVGSTPFNNEAHDFQLALSICKDPLKRPTALEIKNIIE
ncbi:2310_t:CDS:2, partial [Funneliformis geosporum]